MRVAAVLCVIVQMSSVVVYWENIFCLCSSYQCEFCHYDLSVLEKCFKLLRTYCVFLNWQLAYPAVHSRWSTMTHSRKFHMSSSKSLLMSTERTLYATTIVCCN